MQTALRVLVAAISIGLFYFVASFFIERNTTETVTTSLDSIILTGLSQQCTSEVPTFDVLVTSVIHIRDKMARADVIFEKGTSTAERSHYLITASSTYWWAEGAPNGLVFPRELQLGGKIDERIPNWGISHTFTCHAAEIDAKLLEVPATVEFTPYDSVGAK